MKRLLSLFILMVLLMMTVLPANALELNFTELLVVDNDACTIKITGIDPDNWMGFSLKVYLENKTSDKTLMYSVDSASVNGLASDPFWAMEVNAGKKANSTISFMDSELKEQGVTEYTDIELSFRVYDFDDWMSDAVAEVTVHVYPYGADNVQAFQREAQSGDVLLVDNEHLSVTVTGCGMDPIWGYTVKLYIVNKTDKTLMLSAESASINGFMADPFWAVEVAPGKSAASDVSWFTTTLEENGITDVEEIELTLTAYDSNDWSADRLLNQTCTIIP